MSEPLTREQREELRGWQGPYADAINRLLNDLEALEREMEAEKEVKQTAAHNYCRLERECDTLRTQLETRNLDLTICTNVAKHHHAKHREVIVDLRTQLEEDGQKIQVLLRMVEDGNALRAQLENSERFLKIANNTTATLRAGVNDIAQILKSEVSKNADLRARCEQLQKDREYSDSVAKQALAKCNEFRVESEQYAARCEQLEAQVIEAREIASRA